jgi:preprotein translocase subunit SecE
LSAIETAVSETLAILAMSLMVGFFYIIDLTLKHLIKGIKFVKENIIG